MPAQSEQVITSFLTWFAYEKLRVESVKGLKIITTEINTSIPGKLLIVRC
jgi:hypothetical protein